MIGHDDFDRTLAGWFEADALSPAPAGDLDRVFDATRRRRPRPAWLAGPGSHWVGDGQTGGSSTGDRFLRRLGLSWSTALILLLVIVALVGGAILVGARLLQSSPLPTGRLGHLAYGLDGSIYVADSDGTNPIRVADGAYDQGGAGPAGCGSFWGEGPMWSPDGRHLAYRAAWDASCPGTPGGDNVYLSDPAGHVVASFPGTGWLVSWSPDSTRVASWVDLGKTIGLYGLDGVRQALLSVPTGCALPGDFDPVWSPDGTSLVVASCVVPVDGRTPRQAPANDPRSRFTGEYSRDGSRIAFIAYPDSASLVIAKADGTELRVLAGWVGGSNGPGQGADYENPVVSPTGDRVAYIWSPAFYDQTSDPSLSTYELRVVDVASGTVTTLASASGGDHLGATRFSPEGDRILFSRSDADYVGTSLWSVHADGSDAQLLVTGTGWGDWQWQPAGP
jgi:Tol biopolymer transport system component